MPMYSTHSSEKNAALSGPEQLADFHLGSALALACSAKFRFRAEPVATLDIGKEGDGEWDVTHVNMGDR